MYHVTGSEELYLTRLKTPITGERLIYTISLDYKRTIFHNKSPILFKDKNNAQTALSMATCGAEKLYNINVNETFIYDYSAILNDLLNIDSSLAKDTDALSACLEFLLDYCRDTQGITNDLFDFTPVYNDPEKTSKYKYWKSLKHDIPSGYMYYQRLFEAADFFMFRKSYNEYCNTNNCSRKDLVFAINTALGLFFKSALWID